MIIRPIRPGTLSGSGFGRDGVPYPSLTVTGGWDLVIRTEHLTKCYGKRAVVKNVDLRVRAGQIYGLIGPNGAGKTTLLRMLGGAERPTRGTIWLGGTRLERAAIESKRHIGVVSEAFPLYREMTAREYLAFFGRLYQVGRLESRIGHVLELVDLSDRAQEPLRSYSRGMMQRLSLARALLHDPEVLILDEPTSALDPTGMRAVRELLVRENESGKTILISSHILSEIERICHSVGILHDGELVLESEVTALGQRLGQDVEIYLESERSSAAWIEALARLDFVTACRREGRGVRVRVPGDRDYRADLSEWLMRSGVGLLHMEVRRTSLEEALAAIASEEIAMHASRIAGGQRS